MARVSAVMVTSLLLALLMAACISATSTNYNVHGNGSHSNVTSLEAGGPPDNGAKHGGHGSSQGVELVTVHVGGAKYPLVFSIVVILAALSKLGFHYSHFLSSRVPESCVLIVLGVVFGVLLRYTGVTTNITLFSPHEFFLFLLPPIILESAFSLHDRTFAENIGGVLLFAILGTVLNCFLIGFSLFGLYQVGAMEDINCTLVEILLFSALIVAVDPVAVLAVFQEVGVNSTLYFLVFGESLLNDGVTVVLYKVMQTFTTLDNITTTQCSTCGLLRVILPWTKKVALGLVKFLLVVTCGTLIGVICGLMSSFITKYTNTVKVVEPLVIFGFAYLSYLTSEILSFSGIVSIIVCGIIQVHYGFHNITSKSKMTIKFFSSVMATASEIVIFLFLGITTIEQNHVWKTRFTLWALFLCIVFRFIVTFGLSVCINKFSSGRVRKIRADEMFMISYGGLRGAVCFSLVALIDGDTVSMKNMFVTTTLAIIFFTVFIQGGTIKWLVKIMRVKLAQTSSDMSLNEELSSHVCDHVVAGIEEILGYTSGNHYIKEKLDYIDNKWICPTILRSKTKSELEDISQYYEKLVMKEHYKNLQLSGVKLPKVKTDIRHLDSEYAMEQMVNSQDELAGQERHDAQVRKRNQERIEENMKHGDQVHNFLSSTLNSVRNRLHLNVRDKNLVSDGRHCLVGYLKQKHKKNQTLLQIMINNDTGTAPAHLSLSFNLDGTRVSQTSVSDIGYTASNTPSNSQVRFSLLQDSIHETDETGTDRNHSQGAELTEQVKVGTDTESSVITAALKQRGTVTEAADDPRQGPSEAHIVENKEAYTGVCDSRKAQIQQAIVNKAYNDSADDEEKVTFTLD